MQPSSEAHLVVSEVFLVVDGQPLTFSSKVSNDDAVRMAVNYCIDNLIFPSDVSGFSQLMIDGTLYEGSGVFEFRWKLRLEMRKTYIDRFLGD